MAGVNLVKYKIPKDPDAHLRHVFRSNNRDDKEVWHKAYGLRTLLESVASYYKTPLTPNQLRKYRNDDRLLLEWIDTATINDFKTLRSALSRMPWGLNVYNYLFTCWLVYRTKYQSTIVCRVGNNVTELTPAQQVNALNAHLQELKKFATANDYDLLWSFDHDELPLKSEDVKRINTFHVHVYCSHRALFRWCREEGNLLPFVPRHTVLIGTVPVRLPKLRGDGMIDWVYEAPRKADSPFSQTVPNTLSYVAAKVSALHMRQTRPNIEGQSYTVTHGNRTAKYVRKIVNENDPKGKPRKHWGFVGFGIKATKFKME